jgi:hypothetical protein
MFEYEGSLCEKTIAMWRWLAGWLVFGYLILSRKLSSVFPKNPMTIEQLGQVLKT